MARTRRICDGIACSIAAALLSTAEAARALDGVFEISQACATSTAGCFAGDGGASSPGNADGFPVTITRRGSDRLTSDLSLTGDATGIAVEADFVTVDLNGFTIAGQNSCGGTPISCSVTGGSGAGVSGSGRGITVRNGAIVGLNGTGVRLSGGPGLRLENVDVAHNGHNGWSLAPG